MPSDGSSSSTEERIAHERARDRQHLLLAAAHAAAEAVTQFGEIGKQPEQSLRRPRRRRRPSAKRRGGWRPDVEIFQNREIGKDAAVLRREAHAQAGDLERLERGNVASAEAHRAASPRQQPHDAFMVVDLPAPFRPISATTSPRPTVKRDVVKNLRGAVPGVEVLDRERRRRAHETAPARSNVRPLPK